MAELVCGSCGRRQVPDATRWRCACGGLFDLVPRRVDLDPTLVATRPPDLWRYAEAIAVDRRLPDRSDVSMGEGLTPLLAEQFDGAQLLLKVEFAAPTLSFKDRGAVALVAHAAAVGAQHLIADSSGNAGTAISAYAARAGLRCAVYVPATTSAKKLAQMRAHGADVRLVSGSREDAAAAAIEAIEAGGGFYASHVYNPFFVEGVKTYGYEVCEQLGWSAPDTAIVPVGNGTLLLGTYRAFTELMAAGLTDSIPRLVAVQAKGCAPIAAAFASGAETVVPVENTGTLAEGIAIAAPARGDQLLRAIRETGGTVVEVDDEEILTARALLAARGLYVEQTAAAPLAGALAARSASGPLGRCVLPLSGAGLKSG